MAEPQTAQRIAVRRAASRAPAGCVLGRKTLPARLAVSWSATFAGHRGDSPAQLKDISLGGAFVACADPLPLSKRFLITMDFPGRGPLELKAEVVWSNTHVPADRVINRGMGIRFIDNSEEKRKMLSEAVATALRSPAAA